MEDRHRRRTYYFTEYTLSKGLLYSLAISFCFLAAIVSVIEPIVSLPCDGVKDTEHKFPNSVYDASPCRFQRFAKLLLLTREECRNTRRLLSAVILGGIIGWERRQADRPAGIRTMSLVSLGSSLFTIDSTFAFADGSQTWDASRVSAAIPSGVGFLGAGLIFKEQMKNGDEDGGGHTHVVHGLTTAASLWLSAAVGIACGGELYFAASLSTSIILLMLRFGPRNNDADEGCDDDENDDIAEAGGAQVELLPPPGYGGVLPPSPVSVKRRTTGTSADINSETVSLLSGTKAARPRRSASRAALSTAV